MRSWAWLNFGGSNTAELGFNSACPIIESEPSTPLDLKPRLQYPYERFQYSLGFVRTSLLVLGESKSTGGLRLLPIRNPLMFCCLTQERYGQGPEIRPIIPWHFSVAEFSVQRLWCHDPSAESINLHESRLTSYPPSRPQTRQTKNNFRPNRTGCFF